MFGIWNLIILITLFDYSRGLIIQDNVVFEKISEVTTTRSRWLITFVIDMSPYEDFIKKLTIDVENSYSAANRMIRYYQAPRNQGFMNSFQVLRRELDDLKRTREALSLNFLEIRSLNRNKRSVLPFVGRALGFLFGTVSESDMGDIRRNIERLEKNQIDISHIIDENMSILNVSRVQISENRQVINDLVQDVKLVDNKIQNVTRALERQITKLEHFIQLYLQLDLIVEELKQTTNKGMQYLQHLETQLNMLSLGHLSPSTITPNNLRKLLLDIKVRLPQYLKLPADPDNDLWDFYKFLTCTTALSQDKILVVISLPLLDFDSNYQIYKAHNFPLPVYDKNISHRNHPNLIAKFQLESDFLAINPERTKFMLLDYKDIQNCVAHKLGFCNLKNSIFPVHFNKYCIISLFTRNIQAVKSRCQTVVNPNTPLPLAKYLFDGFWVIASQKKETFSVICNHGRSNSKIIEVSPPLEVIKLNQSCSATSEYLSLLPYYHKETTFETTDQFAKLLRYRPNVGTQLWKPIIDKFPKLNKIKVPKELEHVKQINILDLKRKLHSLDFNFETLPPWGYGVGSVSSLFVIIVIVTLVILYCKFKKKCCWTVKQMGVKGVRSISKARYPVMSAQPENVLNVDGEKNSTSPLLLYYGQGQGQPAVEKSLYPSLRFASAPHNGPDGEATSTV